MTKIVKLRKALIKLLDCKLELVEFEGKLVSRTDIYDMINEEELKEKFIQIANWSDVCDMHSSYCNKISNSKLHYQIMFDYTTENNPTTRSWTFKLNMN